MPHQHQAAGRQFHSQVKVEGVNNLADRQPQQKMKHRRENQRAVAGVQ